MTQPTEYVIGFSAGITACMYVYKQVYIMMKDNRQHEQREHERPRNGNGEHVKGVQFGQLTPEDVEGRITAILFQSKESLVGDMRNLIDARLAEKVTTPIVMEIRILSDAINRWMLK